jgi:hypothetical protein
MVGSVRLIKLWNPELLGPEESVNLDEFREAVKELGF